MIRESLGQLRLVLRSVLTEHLSAIDLLELDHLKIRMIFLQIRTTRDQARRRRLYERAVKAFEAHTNMEEEVLYPACEKIEKLRELVLEAREEHHQAKTLLREIEALGSGSEKWQPKVWLLMENIEHHVRVEESQLFPRMRRYFDYQELQAMGDELEHARKPRKKAAA